MKLLLVLTLLLASCSHSKISPASKTSETGAIRPTTVVLASEVRWNQLNPARGDKSPRAATLWGDINGSEATGFLFNAVNGFQSPPHIHNVAYRGLVIEGLIHNDDPAARKMWLPQGSFWTQPAGEEHITAAKGENILAYIEIEQGPYLVLPKEKAFDSGERPVNVDTSNIVWLNLSSLARSSGPLNLGPRQEAQLAFLWGQPREHHLNGSLLKLPVGAALKLTNKDSPFRSVVIQGQPRLKLPGNQNSFELEPGSYFSSSSQAEHQLSCETEVPCVLYFRTVGTLNFH